VARRHNSDSGSTSTATVPSVYAFFRVMRTSPSAAGEDPYRIMRQDFTEAAGTCGSDIELVWVGKRSSFPGTAGAPVPLTCEIGSEFGDDAVNLTDHTVPYVEFALPSAEPPPPPSCAHPHTCSGGTICCADRAPDGRCCEPCESGPVCR
jgi:hypothetical protein